uniref:Uncharacterized protein n=1 Tax=Arundo donax TaxID=35708 RepID=A0A0A8ZAV0_ARUDO
MGDRGSRIRDSWAGRRRRRRRCGWGLYGRRAAWGGGAAGTAQVDLSRGAGGGRWTGRTGR